MRIGQDLQGYGMELCKEVDRELVYAMAEMGGDGRLMESWGIVEGSDFHMAVCEVLRGCLPKVPTSGPTQEAYTRACASKGTRYSFTYNKSNPPRENTRPLNWGVRIQV